MFLLERRIASVDGSKVNRFQRLADTLMDEVVSIRYDAFHICKLLKYDVMLLEISYNSPIFLNVDSYNSNIFLKLDSYISYYILEFSACKHANGFGTMDAEPFCYNDRHAL